MERNGRGCLDGECRGLGGLEAEGPLDVDVVTRPYCLLWATNVVQSSFATSPTPTCVGLSSIIHF